VPEKTKKAPARSLKKKNKAQNGEKLNIGSLEKAE
jgi:hypothetical protein